MKIVHCKKEPYDVYIGRPSLYGNPYAIGRDGNRQNVLDKYTLHLINNPQLQKNLIQLRGKILGCWCKPKICHGDIIEFFLGNCTDEEIMQGNISRFTERYEIKVVIQAYGNLYT